MFRRKINSIFGTILLSAILPLVLISAIRPRIGFAWPRKKAQSPAPSSQPSPSAKPLAGQFQFDHAIEAYEQLIDSVIAEDQV